VVVRKGYMHGFYGDDWAVVIMAMRHPDHGTAADVLQGWAAMSTTIRPGED